MKLIHVVGARPNFPKLAPVFQAGERARIDQYIIHTGQHYDEIMSDSFFAELQIPRPHANLGVGSDSHAVQTARIMERIEPILISEKPDWVVIYGDVNSTLAAALVASKLQIPIAHVEAGLRSGDRSMPEEINRLVADRLSTLLLTPSHAAGRTLLNEGVEFSAIKFVGNVMIDSLLAALPRAAETNASKCHGAAGEHVLVTLHRPSNVDDPVRFPLILRALNEIGADRPVLFAVHPRTRACIDASGVELPNVKLLEPQRYHAMVDLLTNAFAVITDSGGLQEETTALGVPCFTVRDNTERPITITEGTNQLVSDIGSLPSLILNVKRSSEHQRPEGWDGLAGERVVQALLGFPKCH